MHVKGARSLLGHCVRAVVIFSLSGQTKMFSLEEFFCGAMFGMIGGIITVLFIKLLEKMEEGKRGNKDSRKSGKQPSQHDVRCC